MSSLARRTFVAMNLQVVWMAVRRMVRSPLAWGAEEACELRTWRVLETTASEVEEGE